MSDGQPGGRRGNRFVRRASYGAAVLLSAGCVAISALGLAGVLDREQTPSAPVVAAASQIAADERDDGYCPWGDRDRRERVELPSRPKV